MGADGGTGRIKPDLHDWWLHVPRESVIVCRWGLGLSPPPLIRLIPDFDSRCQAEVTWLTRRAEPFDLRRGNSTTMTGLTPVG